MRNLLRLTYKYSHIGLFLVLEAVALGLLIRQNNYHNYAFVNASSDVVGTLYDWRSNVTDYFSLKEQNEQLAGTNAKLMSNSEDAFLLRTYNNLKTTHDTFYIRKYDYQQARVVNNSTQLLNNNITINKGTRDGIEADMGVIGPDGIVGFVTHVSEHYAVVASVLNKKKFNVSVRTRKNHYSGIVKWKGYDPQEIVLEEVPGYAQLEAGDTIVTSGASGRFPENIPVGIIVKVEDAEKSNALFARVRTSTNFHNLYFVYVIHNLQKEEQLNLERAARDQ